MFGFLGDLIPGIASGFVSDWFNRRVERRTFSDNAQLSWQMWNAQNEYNTPANQMKRFREAGLNPNLIYGQTNTAAPISVPSSKGVPPQFNALLGQQLSNMRLENASKMQQMDLARQQMQLSKMTTQSNLAYQQAQIAGQMLNNQAQAALLGYASKEGLPPQVVLGELQGGLSAMIFKVLKNEGIDGLVKMLRWSNKDNNVVNGGKPPKNPPVTPWGFMEGQYL